MPSARWSVSSASTPRSSPRRRRSSPSDRPRRRDCPAMAAGWPFWAATSDERIEQALDLAELQPGEHLIDLGCGDGRVLLRAAADRDAKVTGVELDRELASRARALLDALDVGAEVIEADFTTVDLADVDVVFAYLSPATLQRLESHLAAC